ncbi:hypothetical protein SAMN05216361_4383 [Marisediminitalea aggregata]|uniref:Phage integrase family protein n=1 Tax=Marisediminitalea aggregata TaxID=634436 RepID=A0A1M5SBW6_9ALTE|nr:hypothetical protein [Marisediminitalea aggregata]SHH36112.1 hypothetical protein SAMN05216361_4383 [Marisediminitalea aggregata]
MNTTHHITLSTIQKVDGNAPVTLNPDGTTLSRIFDVVWYFSGQEQNKVNSVLTVTFGYIDTEYRQDIQAALALIMNAYKERKRTVPSRSQVRQWKDGLLDVRQFLGSSDWGSLSDDVIYNRFKRSLKNRIRERMWSKGKANLIATALNKLRESGLSSRIPDCKEIKSWVVKERQQHIAIPIRMYQQIIAQAIDVVETYHPHRYAISEIQTVVDEIHREESARTDVKPTSANGRAAYRVSELQHAIPNYKPSKKGTNLRRILDACAMVALAFSGVRVGELISMNKHSYEEKGASAIPTLVGEETKREGLPIRETWQTHRVVKDALELATDATQYLRDIYTSKNNKNLKDGSISQEQYKHYVRQINSAFLATQCEKVKTSYCGSNADRTFNTFIASSGIVATQADVEEFDRLNPSRNGQLMVGGTLPKLTPHDFRRSFAVFFKRYGFGSSATIKFQYKHRNINMSNYYSNNAQLQRMEDVLLDNDLLALLNEEGIRMGVDIFDEIYNESEQLGGAGGERIAKDKFERLRSGEHVYMTRSEIDRLVRNGTLSVVKLPTGGYCTNATCSRVCGIGEFTTEIKPCEHQVITDNQAKVILRQNRRIIKAFREMNTGDPMMNSILIGQKQKIKRNEQMIKDFNLSFEPFDDKIKGIIETAGA